MFLFWKMAGILSARETCGKLGRNLGVKRQRNREVSRGSGEIYGRWGVNTRGGKISGKWGGLWEVGRYPGSWKTSENGENLEGGEYLVRAGKFVKQDRLR